jgi:hypothetical protein
MIDRWAEKENTHVQNVRLNGDENFEGPVKARSCTDIVFLVIFMIASAACGVVIVYCKP